MSGIPPVQCTVAKCYCCGGTQFAGKPVLWPALIEEWALSPGEVKYIDRQQGVVCTKCGCNLRSNALARAILGCFDYAGALKNFVRKPLLRLRILELNGAGTLTPYLARIRGHRLCHYPEVNMLALPFGDETFDLVVHSDSLEHVPDPVRALSECCRVLKKGGFCAFTVPIVVGRMTVSRAGKPPSYHGTEAQKQDDFVVHTEYGADAWRHVIEAGFDECRIVSAEYPSAQALVGVKRH